MASIECLNMITPYPLMPSTSDLRTWNLFHWVRQKKYELNEEEFALCDALLASEFHPRAPFWGMSFALLGYRLPGFYVRGRRWSNLGRALVLYLYGYEWGTRFPIHYPSTSFMRDMKHLEGSMGKRARVLLNTTRGELLSPSYASSTTQMEHNPLKKIQKQKSSLIASRSKKKSDLFFARKEAPSCIGETTVKEEQGNIQSPTTTSFDIPVHSMQEFTQRSRPSCMETKPSLKQSRPQTSPDHGSMSLARIFYNVTSFLALRNLTQKVKSSFVNNNQRDSLGESPIFLRHKWAVELREKLVNHRDEFSRLYWKIFLRHHKSSS